MLFTWLFNVIYVVIGNKIDLLEQEQVTEQERKEYAELINALFLSTSCSTGVGVDRFFDCFDIEKENTESAGIKLHSLNEEKENCCNGKQRNK